MPPCIRTVYACAREHACYAQGIVGNTQGERGGRVAHAYIGIGSNMGDRLGHVRRAIDLMGQLDGVRVVAESPAYESEAWPDPTDPRFVNAAVKLDTRLDAFELLGALQGVETAMGRERSVPNAPRVIDLDILLVDDDEIVSPSLAVPHPRLLEREFAVRPLLDLTPDVRLPNGVRIADAPAPTEGRILRALGPLGDPGEDRNEPMFATDWVAVSETTGSSAVIAGPDPAIVFDASILSTEGIPFAWDPYEPGGMSDPIAVDMTWKLLVPAEHAAWAKAVLADVGNAVVVLDEELEFAASAEPDEQEYS